MWDWWRNINYNISFNFRLFPGKAKGKIFQKIQKTLFWGRFGPFSFPLSVFKYSNARVLIMQNQKKLTCHSWEKCPTDRWTGRRTDRQWWFIGPSLGQGSNNLLNNLVWNQESQTTQGLFSSFKVCLLRLYLTILIIIFLVHMAVIT